MRERRKVNKKKNIQELHEGLLFKKIIGDLNTVSYSEVGLLTSFDNYQGKKSIVGPDEIMGNWQSTDEGRKIITSSNYDFARDDRFSINGSMYIISNIEYEEDEDLKRGALRGDSNIDYTILTLT